MQVRYSKALAWTVLGLGVIQLALQAWLFTLGRGNVLHLIPGVVCVLVGIGYLTRPFFTIEGNEVVFKALIGPLAKRLPYGAGELRIEKNALFVGSKKTGGRRWMANNDDWDAMATQIASADAFE